MLPEISLNIMDIVQNSIHASASIIEITIDIAEEKDLMTIGIKDNGNGMTKEELELVESPFYTTRTTRKVGLGLSFFKLACELTGGNLSVQSEKSCGTTIQATLTLSHIDRMPLGDITSTIHTLIVTNEKLDFIYHYSFNNNTLTLDTREIRQKLGDIPLFTPDVSNFIREYLEENKKEIDGGKVY